MTREFFQYLVIGGGSGGIASARRAAQYGAKVGVVEAGAIGGTCVNVGCVPKKIMYNTAHVLEAVKDARYYGFSGLPVFNAPSEKSLNSSFDYKALHKERDDYIRRLNNIYLTNLEKEKVRLIVGRARFEDKRPENASANIVVSIDNGRVEVEAERVLIAAGSEATLPEDVPGAVEFGETSDGFFSMPEWPKKVAVVGSGYIAVELAGLMHHLGVQVHLFARHSHVLRTFDAMIQEAVTEEYEKTGVNIH